MQRALVLCFLLPLLLLQTAKARAADAPDPLPSAEAILNRVDDLYRGESSQGRMTMKIVTEHWTRNLELEFWAKGKDRSLIRILAPRKEKGTATLRVGNDIWNYLPKVNRVIKLPSSMMSASWMGSHFTNDDLVKESRFTEDYTFEITFEGRRDGREVVDITCAPKPEAAVVWGKVVVTVRGVDYLPLQSVYFDEDMDPARSMTFDAIKELGGRMLPSRLTVQPEHEPDQRTVVTYQAIDFNVDLKDSFFSLRTLRR